MRTDELKLIVQLNGDGGDTCQREGWAWFGIWIRECLLHKPWEIQLEISFEQTMQLLEIDQSGNFRRHPTQVPWNDPSKEPGIFTRDQQTPIVAALGVWNDQARLKRMWDNLKPSPLGLGLKVIQGFDIAGFDHLNLFRRAMNQPPDDSGDKQLAAGVGTRLFELSVLNKLRGKDTMDDVDDLSLIVNLLMGLIRSPSDAVKRAAEVYAKNREVSYGCYLGHYRAEHPGDYSADLKTMSQRIREGISKGWQPDCPRVLGALRWYFRPESGGNPELAELYAPIVEAYLI